MRRLLAWLVVPALLSLASCEVVVVGDLEVTWSIDGLQDTSLCSTHGIARWELEARGPEIVPPTPVTCGTWIMRTVVEEGSYTVTLRALNSAGVSLAMMSQTVLVPTISTHPFSFKAADFPASSACGDGTCEDTKGETCTTCPADCGHCTYLCGDQTCETAKGENCYSCPGDCGPCYVCGNSTCESAQGETCESCPGDCPCAGPQINVYWNINGTVDGTPKGTSWDTCAEVSAVKALVTVDGSPTTFDCFAGGQMSGAVAVTEGNHTVAVKLQDVSGADITTETIPATISATLTKPGELYADFYWDSFLLLQNTMEGDYWFETTYEGGKSCSGTSPQVSYQVSLVKLSGVPVDPPPDVCDPDNVCVKADGAAFADCLGPGETQKLKGMLWGDYKLKIQGTLGQGAGYEACWETKNVAGTSNEVDILVGAGLTNPKVIHDLVRVNTSGSCQ